MSRLAAVLALCTFACSSSKTTTEKTKPAEAPRPAPPAREAPPPLAKKAKAPKAPVPLSEYFKIRRFSSYLLSGASISYDDKLVGYLSDEGGRLEMWVQPVAGGEARQLTHVQGIVHSFEFSPAGDDLVYEADNGGDELAHLYLTTSKGESPRDLGAGDPKGSRTMFIRWADDGRTLLYLCSRRDPRNLDLYEYDLGTRRSTLLWKASGTVSFALPSRDHRRFVLVDSLSDVDTNVYLLERGASKPVLLTPHKGDILYAPGAFSADGKRLYLTSDESGEFQSAYVMDLGTRKVTPLLQEKWDVDRVELSRGYRYLLTVTNEDGAPKVVLTDTKTEKPVAMPSAGAPGVLVPYAFSKSDRYAVARLAGETSPPVPYLVDFQEQRARRLVDPWPASLRNQKMAPARLVRIPSFDGRQVPAFLYVPGGSGPFPAVIFVHGGPTDQSKRNFDAMLQYLVSKGYVVLVPNVRGSTGYGKTYTKLDNLDFGGGPLRDVVACKNWLVKSANADAQRIAVVGGSYGGYMALAAATFTPGEFAAQVDYFGVSDLKSLVESFPAYWSSAANIIYKKFGNPKDPAHAKYLHDRSPLYFADRIQSPLLVVQGENDPRVRKDQSDRIVAAVKARKVPVHYLVLPGEGHGFSKNENRLKAFEATDRFLDRYLFGDESVQVIP
jgi:dipeptidyl aminopeptidase/acylaminoacyl peptidase